MDLLNDIASCHRLILDLEGIKPPLEGYVWQIADQQQQITRQRQQFAQQRQQIMHLEARVEESAFQLHQNSYHSSRPPSADSYRKAPALSRAKGGPIGGKKGHNGGPLKRVDTPDKIIDHQQDVCVHGGKVHVHEPLTRRTRRQVFDIPQPHLEVTEHRVLDWVCGSCPQHNPGVFPARVSAPTQYGLRLQTPGVLFNSAYNIPRNKVQCNPFNELLTALSGGIPQYRSKPC